MRPTTSRREFLIGCAACAAAQAAPPFAFSAQADVQFEVSLVETSLRRSFAAKTFKHLDFANVASELGIFAIEYATEFFPAPDETLLGEMNERAGENGVRQLLIMVADDVRIGDADAAARRQAVRTVCDWIEVATKLACHSVQINAGSVGAEADQRKRAVESLSELCEYAAPKKINVLIGNSKGAAANASWVESVIKTVGSPCCRALPRINGLKTDEDYQNLAKLIPFAKGLTADAWGFDEQGNETETDYVRAMEVIANTGYHGYVGINYCGANLDEKAGIQAAKALLDRLRSPSQ